MEYIDYYKVLGIQKNATADDIKKAYRKLAKQYHPDANPNDVSAKKKFQEINEANEVLSDPANRKKFDTYGKDWQHGDAYAQQARQQRQYAQQFGGSGNDEGFSDFFSSFFGGSGRRATKQKGQNQNATFLLNLTDAFKTHQQTITINGKNIKITIPAGTDNGQILKLKGQGQPSQNGGESGDLYLTFNIKNDTFFNRIGNDLHLIQELDLYTALLGGTIEITTLHGKVKLKVHPCTQNNAKIRLKGKGFSVPKQENVFGDLFVTYNIKIPATLTAKEVELFTQLQKEKF
ncbi:MAG: DnaJ C-terminal domain-containing protein [Ferruginibacter sp.]|nr:DnaJ domain-containing protein [Ferruginibacter sp.]